MQSSIVCNSVMTIPEALLGPASHSGSPGRFRYGTTALSGMESGDLASPRSPAWSFPKVRRGSASHFLQVLMDELDRHGSFADGRRHSLHRARAHVAGREHARPTGLEQQRRTLPRPVLRGPAPTRCDEPLGVGLISCGSHSVRGTAPMKLKSAAVSMLAFRQSCVDDLDGERPSPYMRVISVWRSISTSRSARSAGRGSWTCSCTDHRRASAGTP